MRDGQHGYTPSLGLIPLREAVKRIYRYAMDLPTYLTNSDYPWGKPVIFMAAMIYGGKGKEILMPNPSFPIYESAVSYSGATPIFYELDERKGFSFDAEEILSKITKQTTLIMINTPHNPSGGITPPSEIKS
ncbi:MAG: hypothetical protein CM15mP117_19230 [Alphaproteobacteria bacterium]|nr:MAG: hypothetical protein CM15mP117_19230 [Alphaproteobacteria bacterium]